MHTAAKSARVFISYAHADDILRKELEKHLSILRRQGFISVWSDREIGAGSEWDGQIDKEIRTADIILLLISPDFIGSDYCWDVEVKCAMERHERREALVIPIILRPTDWQNAPFARIQALPQDAKPITEWSNVDSAFVNIAQGIRKAVLTLLKRT